MSRLPWLLVAVVVCFAVMPAPAEAANAALFQSLNYTWGSNSMSYRLYVPADYDASKQYPVMLFLHGAGERGSDNTAQINGNIDNLFNHISTGQYESIVIAPQVSANGWWGGVSNDMAMKITQLVETQYSVNPNKVFCTGLSMGGGGVWDMAARYTSEFDAFVPCCGTQYDTSVATATKIASKPGWAFHCADDGTVSVSATRSMINAIDNAGGGSNWRYTEFPTGGHGGGWTQAYATAALYPWLYGTPAGPQLTYTKQDLGNGKFGYTFSIHNTDGKLLSYATTLAFQGVNGATVQQTAYDDISIDTEGSATRNDGKNGYLKAQDSWVCSPFGTLVPGVNPLDGTSVLGYVEGTNSYVISVATATNSQFGDGVRVAYVVADGDLSWTGSISRDSYQYSTSGVTPEPTTLVTLLVGGLAAIRKGRKIA